MTRRVALVETVPTSLTAVTEYFPPSLGFADLMRRLCRSPSTFSTQTPLPARTVCSLLQVTGKYNHTCLWFLRVRNHKHVVAEDYGTHDTKV